MERSYPPRAPDGEAVVLLHGMGRSWMSMALLAVRLRSAGYETHLFGYNPRRESLQDLSQRLHRMTESEVREDRFHLVGHSLGNIIIRNGFRSRIPEGLERIVMLAPPNGPSELASALRHTRIFQWWAGDSGQKLGDQDFYQGLPVPSVEFGVIAGDKGHRIGFDDANDGVVRVEKTKLEGMADWVLVHHTHTLIMLARDTFELSHRFLATGRFGEPEG